MADFRAFPLNTTGPGYSLVVTLETAEPNMTVGDRYEILGCAIDNASTPPKPYAVLFGDDGHFKLVELAKLKRLQPAA